MALSCKVFVDSLREATLILWIRVTSLAQIRLKPTNQVKMNYLVQQLPSRNLKIIDKQLPVNSVGHCSQINKLLLLMLFSRWTNPTLEWNRSKRRNPVPGSGLWSQGMPRIPNLMSLWNLLSLILNIVVQTPKAPSQPEVWIVGTQRNDISNVTEFPSARVSVLTWSILSWPWHCPKSTSGVKSLHIGDVRIHWKV